MNKFKEEIIKHQLDSIEFVKSLNALSEKEWRTQIEYGKWTVAEIIGHFKPWDEFVLHKRHVDPSYLRFFHYPYLPYSYKGMLF
ncbi:hypothetical protein ACWV26_11595 [Rummeliibacillus sp. JY-2-4R]